jgi:predicted O-linked N-acetylglucosamine transferase (SPINDLY family)
MSNVDGLDFVNLSRVILEFQEKKAPTDEEYGVFLRCVRSSLPGLTLNEQAQLEHPLLYLALNFSHEHGRHEPAAQLMSVIYENRPTLETLRNLSLCLQTKGEYEHGVSTAQGALDWSKPGLEKVFGIYLLLRSYLSAGKYWNKAYQLMLEFKGAIANLTPADFAAASDPCEIVRIFTTSFWLPYISDSPRANNEIHYQLGKLASQELCKRNSEFIPKLPTQRSVGKLRIGFVSHCFKRHSVGFLVRHLLQKIDRQKFDIYTYAALPVNSDPIQNWILANTISRKCTGRTGLELANLIAKDELDVLIDLDSRTLDFTVEALSYKPARKQVSWLGWDDVHLDCMDYFIGDRHVFCPGAQDHYRTKLYEMPNTYIAVGGFEMGLKTVTRASLGIDADTVVFMSGQRSFKFNPELMVTQIEILKEVPNSVLLIKGLPFREYIEELCIKAGVKSRRVIQLPFTITEEDHRLMLSILPDVVLDSFPYNGATTTLETLWAGTPLVTMYGNQFSSRTSYSALKNIGLPDHLFFAAENPLDYQMMAIALGRGKSLRDSYRSAILDSRRYAPLWDVDQFARDFEDMLMHVAGEA